LLGITPYGPYLLLTLFFFPFFGGFLYRLSPFIICVSGIRLSGGSLTVDFAQ
jgi:hypothetical protein